MSKTLFWYIFWQLARIFLMATGTLAGIMSFGGILRPLTENGLSMWQVNRLLLYMMPAMCTYSLPVAALFAATVVYGRFAADNELTAMRAGGISYLSPRRFSIALPALVLGLIVAFVSLIMLCFIVPIYSLSVQQIIYSNIAQVITSKIDRDHEFDFHGGGLGNELEIFAQQANLMPPDPAQPLTQTVQLIAPAIVMYENPTAVHPDLQVPREFWMARSAWVSITRSSDSVFDAVPMGSRKVPPAAAVLHVRLVDGTRFPRQFSGNLQGGVAATSFGPVEIPSLINENVKFMDITRLSALATDAGQSQKVQVLLREQIRYDQEAAYLNLIATEINRRDALSSMGADAKYSFISDNLEGDTFAIKGSNPSAQVRGEELVITSPPWGDDSRAVWLTQNHVSQQTLLAKAREIRVRAKPDSATQRMDVGVELYDAEITTQEGPSERPSFLRSFSVPMPDSVRQLENKTLEEFRADPAVPRTAKVMLDHEQMVVNNASVSELNSRASFALSCLVLVMMGCALGVMFRSGNFLTAFAVSFMPALLCITLIVCGQQIATHVPYDVGAGIRDPLHVGLWFIWTGDLVVMGAAICLTGRLLRR